MRKEVKRNIRQHSGNFQSRDIGVLVHWRFPGLDAFPVYPFAYEDTRDTNVLFSVKNSAAT